MERWVAYLLRRLLTLAIGIFVILTVMFVLFRVAPGDPSHLATPRDPKFDYQGYFDEVNALFDKPLFEQFPEFVGDMLTGDFHMSWTYEMDVSDIIYGPAGRTLALFLSSLALSFVLGSVLGFLIYRLRTHVPRQVASLLMVAMYAVPGIVTAWVLIHMFSVWMEVLPSHGWTYPGTSESVLAVYVIPVAATFLAMVGPFALAVRDGCARASSVSVQGRVRFTDGLFTALPNIQFLIAGSMCLIIAVEVLYDFGGLGRLFVASMYHLDYFLIQASFFLLAIMVFLANFCLESLATLARHGQRLDQYLNEAGDERGVVTPGEAQPEVYASDAGGAGATDFVSGIIRDYLRSPVGVVSLVVFLGLVVFAVVGPMLSSNEIVSPYIFSSTDMFLDGASALVWVSLIVGIVAALVGTLIGFLAGLGRPYADSVLTGAMHGLIAIPVVCVVGARLLVDLSGLSSVEPDYLGATLTLLIPVVALVTLLVCHGVVSWRSRSATLDRGTTRTKLSVRAFPAMISWTLSGLKYGMPMTAVAVFTCDFLHLTRLDSWGESVGLAYSYSMLLTGEWDYVLLPLVGMFLLVGSMFLVLDTLERVVRTRVASVA